LSNRYFLYTNRLSLYPGGSLTKSICPPKPAPHFSKALPPEGAQDDKKGAAAPTRRPSRDRRQTAMQSRAKAGPGGRLQAPEAEQHAIHPFYRGISPRKAQNPKSFP